MGGVIRVSRAASGSFWAEAAGLLAEGSRVLVSGEAHGPLARALQERRCEFVVAPADGRGWRAAAGFDAVALVDVLEDADDPVTLLEAARSALGPDGVLLATARNASHAPTRLAMLGGRLGGDDPAARPPRRLFGLDGLGATLASAGFAIGRLDREGDDPARESERSPEPGLVTAELREALAGAPEADTLRFLLVAYPNVGGFGLLARRLHEAGGRERALKSEVASLRRVAAEQGARVDALSARLEALERGESGLRKVLANGDDLAAPDNRLNVAYRTLRGGPAVRVDPEPRARRGAAPSPYASLVERVRSAALASLPPGSTVAVVSRGDEELVRIDGLRGWHFPQTPEGVYAGYHPADGRAAVAHLEEVRRRGAGYLLIPQTAFWWLDYYDEFRGHLDGRCEEIARLDDVCVVYRLGDRAVNGRGV